jgi:TonB family protein
MKFYFVLITAIFTAHSIYAQQKESKPASILCPPIAYPEQSRKKEEEGTIHLLIKVNKDSTAGNIVIEKSSGYPRLDSAAVELIPKCQIAAAVRESVPYDSMNRLRFTFRLEEGNLRNNNTLSESDRIKMENFRRLAATTGASNDFESMPYSLRLAQKIKPNITFVGQVQGNPSTSVEIKCAEDGKIIGVRLVESSGKKEWDEAVLKAVVNTGILPLDNNGKIPSVLMINFKPNE